MDVGSEPFQNTVVDFHGVICQAYFIKNDLKMYDEAQDTPANARTTCLGMPCYVSSKHGE